MRNVSHLKGNKLQQFIDTAEISAFYIVATGKSQLIVVDPYLMRTPRCGVQLLDHL
jgi:hypothetical protein